MAATPEGNRKSHETLKRRLGEAGYRAYMASIGARGGKAYVKKGFAVTSNQFNVGSFERTNYDKKLQEEEARHETVVDERPVQ